ncbi:MAG: hypothetical protein KKC20_06140 [Proteobacteria bacterium]|nr:hypothetical protein [Pseudomonadota bacterium]
MDKKKLAAVMAAVGAYINTGRAGDACQELTPVETVPQSLSRMPACQTNLWGVAGRQSLMQASTMMQMRMFK